MYTRGKRAGRKAVVSQATSSLLGLGWAQRQHLPPLTDSAAVSVPATDPTLHEINTNLWGPRAVTCQSLDAPSVPLMPIQSYD